MRLSRATPDKVAKTIVRTIRRRNPPLRVPATFDAHLFAWLRRLLSRRLYHWVLYRLLPEVRTWGQEEEVCLLPGPRDAAEPAPAVGAGARAAGATPADGPPGGDRSAR